MIAPERAIVKTALENELRQKAELHTRDGESVNYREFVGQFESKCDEWSDVTSSSPIWLVDWAGKDILVSLCRWLAAEFGIITSPDCRRTRVDWNSLAGEKNPDGSLRRSDQEIERLMLHELQPKLVNTFLEHLPSTDSDAQREWLSLANVVAETASRRKM